MNNLMLIAHELLCLLLIYTVFCRAVRTDHTVRVDVRLSFFLLGVVACFGVPAPLIWGLIPNTFTLLLLAGVTIVQISTARHWVDGVPHVFYKPECAPRRRRSDDQGDRRDQ